MSKVVSSVYFLSRFPRFMVNQRHLWEQERSYMTVRELDLLDHILAHGSVQGAPATYEAFNAAAKGDVLAWPRAWVHRFNASHAVGGVEVEQHAVQGYSQLIGSVRRVAEMLACGESLRRYHQGSGGGRNVYVVPPL